MLKPCLVLVLLAAGGSAPAEDAKPAVKDEIKAAGTEVGHAARDGVHAVGKVAKEGGKAVGKVAKKVGKGARKVGEGVKEGAKDVGHGVKDAVKGN